MGIKAFAIFEALVIIVLVAALIWITQKQTIEINTDANKFLSSRIYSGVLEPQSYLIMNYAPLENELRTYIDTNNLSMSVYVENLRDGAEMGIHEGHSYPPASMSKLPLAILIMKKVERGELSLDTEISIEDDDRNESSGELYFSPTKQLSVRELLEAMLIKSDNTAFNVLLKNADTKDFETLIDKYYGYFHPPDKNDTDDPYYVTPLAFYNVFSSLYLSTVLEPQDSEYILQLLSNSTFDIREMAQLPQNVTIAHKYGIRYRGDEKYFHDCGIIYVNNYETSLRIFYCIMTEGMDEDTAIEINARIINKIYYYSTETREELDQYKKGFLEGAEE